MKHIPWLVAVIAFLTATPARPEMFGTDYQPCGQKQSTLDIVACVDAKTKIWDLRLNAAYKALQQRIDAGQAESLRAAQRLWVQYRDANCRFYGSAEGSIREVQAAECMRSMTQDRALELERAARA